MNLVFMPLLLSLPLDHLDVGKFPNVRIESKIAI